MPSYRTHVRINLFLALPFSLAALKGLLSPNLDDLFYFSSAFAYGTLFLHPDLDLTRQVRIFSLKGLLTLPFRPYSYLFRHRGISHIPLIGTATRLLWLIAVIWFFCSTLGWAFPDLKEWDSISLRYALCGIAIADLCHVALDRIA